MDGVFHRYPVRLDMASRLVNDPNAWSQSRRHMLDLMERVVRISMETQRLIGTLSPLTAVMSPEGRP